MDTPVATDGRPIPSLSDPVLSTEQVAGLTGLTAHSIKHQRRAGRLAGFVLAGHLRFNLSDVEAYIRNAKAADPTAAVARSDRAARAMESRRAKAQCQEVAP